MEERFIELEYRIAFHEKTIEELNEVVAKQQRQIDALEQEIAFVRKHLQSTLIDPQKNRPGNRMIPEE